MLFDVIKNNCSFILLTELAGLAAHSSTAALLIFTDALDSRRVYCNVMPIPGSIIIFVYV